MSQELLEMLAELNPDALLADGLEAALVGYTVNHHIPHVAVYDIAKCIEALVARDGMTHEEADEFLSFNTLGAFVGENGPIYIRTAP
jgi:hypothetical protein